MDNGFSARVVDCLPAPLVHAWTVSCHLLLLLYSIDTDTLFSTAFCQYEWISIVYYP